MADSQSPIICVTCHREFPDDLEAEKSPRYFGQYSLLPKRDDAFDFASEVQNLCRYSKAISDVMSYGDHTDIEQNTYNTLFQLVGQLSEEALRHTELTIEAARVVADREYKAEQAAQAQKEAEKPKKPALSTRSKGKV